MGNKERQLCVSDKGSCDTTEQSLCRARATVSTQDQKARLLGCRIIQNGVRHGFTLRRQLGDLDNSPVTIEMREQILSWFLTIIVRLTIAIDRKDRHLFRAGDEWHCVRGCPPGFTASIPGKDHGIPDH